MRVSLLARVACGLIWRIVLLWVSLPIRWSIPFSFWRAVVGGAFAMVVVSVAGSSSVASFADSSALSFPSIPMCPGTHETSMLTLRFSSRNDIAASTNPCDICWLGPGFSSVIASTEDVLSANSMIVDRLLFNSGVSCWKSIAASSSTLVDGVKSK